MKSAVLFASLFFCLLLSCKKETQYRSTSIQDTIITPDTTVKNDTLIVRDSLMPGSDTITHRKDTVVNIKK